MTTVHLTSDDLIHCAREEVAAAVKHLGFIAAAASKNLGFTSPVDSKVFTAMDGVERVTVDAQCESTDDLTVMVRGTIQQADHPSRAFAITVKLAKSEGGESFWLQAAHSKTFEVLTCNAGSIRHALGEACTPSTPSA